MNLVLDDVKEITRGMRAANTRPLHRHFPHLSISLSPINLSFNCYRQNTLKTNTKPYRRRRQHLLPTPRSPSRPRNSPRPHLSSRRQRRDRKSLCTASRGGKRCSHLSKQRSYTVKMQQRDRRCETAYHSRQSDLGLKIQRRRDEEKIQTHAELGIEGQAVRHSAPFLFKFCFVEGITLSLARPSPARTQKKESTSTLYDPDSRVSIKDSANEKKIKNWL
jgi:hypothetical protein